MDISKKGRGKRKSSSNSELTPNDEISLKEEEPNLNGDKSHSKDKDVIENENTEGTKENIEDKTQDSKGDELNGESKDEAKELEVSENNDIKENQTSETDVVKDAEKSDNTSTEVANTLEHTHDSSATMEIIDNPKEKVPKGRKRKISEIKLNDPKIEKENAVGEELQILTNDETLDIEMYPSGSTEPLGKGKRARIPNKRYSDILISPTLAKKPAVAAAVGLENGNVEKLDSGNDTDDTFIKDEYESSSKKAKLDTDLSDPKFLKPFDFGWKRELVWRSIYDESKPRIGDIYYWSPEAKKVRSRREVVENLKDKELSIDNFSFFAQPIGIDDPEKEMIREATGKQPLVKQVITKSLKNSPASSSKRLKRASYKLTSPKLASPKVSSPKLASSKVSSPKLASPKVASPKLVAIPKVTSPRLGSPRVLPMKVGLNETADSPSKIRTRNSKIIKMNASMKIEKMEVEESPSKTPTARRGRKPSYEEEDDDDDGDGGGGGSDVGSDVVIPTKPCQPCSIRCKGIHGIVPTLQCRICLCLYHHECVGVSPALMSLPYVCKNCHLDGQEQAPAQSTSLLTTLPPLTPINILKSSGNQLSALPKLQRIPKPTDLEASLEPDPLPEPPKLTPRPEMKSLVGSLTTWLPHNSKIIDNIEEVGESYSGGVPRPQYVEILAGRKFLVIPKHNFMSVSPTATATAVVTRSEEIPFSVDSANLGSDVKIEPDSPSKPENSLIPEAMEIDAYSTSEREPTMEGAETGTSKSEQSAIQKTPVTAPSPPAVATAKVVTKKRTIKLSSITNSEEKDREETKLMDNFLQNVSYGYNTLLYVFQYLKVQDLLRAGCVCTLWRDLASHPTLWRTVRMKNSQVHSFDGLADSLKKHRTKHLDLRKMLLPNGGDEIWPEFSKAIAKVETLRRIELCRCPASVVENLALSNPQLEVVNAVTIKCESMNLESLKSLTEIKELRLKSTGGLTLTSNVDSLKEMKALKHLSLTSIRDLDGMHLNVIAELTNLESLDLGECTDFPKNFGSDILIKLKSLERLRLEKGQGNCHTFEILEAVKEMNQLDQLELVNFDIKAGFDKALGACQNIKKLLIIPTYISQSATTNHMVLGGVLRLQKTLSHFVWGVTLELLRVTELFVDQCEEPKEKKDKKQAGASGDCIPVLKPVPLLLEKSSEVAPALEPPQVEILALPSLQKLLMQNLPSTRVKILKIPFHATWRQSITDSVN